jgi:alkylhydroperoxidase/carboxymuconolactone decarboxylase family protein
VDAPSALRGRAVSQTCRKRIQIPSAAVSEGWHHSTRKADRMDSYYHTHDLGKFADMGKGNKELWDKFMSYYGAVFAEGALTEREKALIALGVSHAVQCPYCIDAYTQACLEKGSNMEQMTEAVHVACAIRGGASLVHGVQMRNVAEKLSM